MPSVTVVNRDNQTFEVVESRSILAGARAAKEPWRAYCGGKALCGTCCVLVVDGKLDEPGDIERYFIEGWGYHPSYRLACQAHVIDSVSVLSCSDLGFEEEAVLTAYENALRDHQRKEK